MRSMVEGRRTQSAVCDGGASTTLRRSPSPRNRGEKFLRTGTGR